METNQEDEIESLPTVLTVAYSLSGSFSMDPLDDMSPSSDTHFASATQGHNSMPFPPGLGSPSDIELGS